MSTPARPVPGERTPPPGSGTPRRSWRTRLFQAEERTAPYVYVAPFFLLFAAFGLFPLIYTAWISLHSYKLGSEMDWLGLDNYVWLFSNPDFYNSLWKTFTIGVLSTVPQLMIALGLAHLLNYRMRGRTFFRVAMIMPYATSVAAAALVFAQLFGRDAGAVNWLLGVIGVDAVDWRNGDWTAQLAISVIVIWRWTGYNALIYLAGMQSISQDLYEAAALDGASRWQQFRHVTLPGLRPTILFTVVVSTIGASQLFGEPLIFGGGQPDGGALGQYQTLGLFMYQQGWTYGSLGRAATVAWVTFLVIIVLVLVNTAITKRRRT
ncbi:sugar ABC transporter permease [Pseudonocardia sp. KRD-184]|uniref:Sugar ABC transporter permease n=1 Tax=Pseudonocardia oceani TaxID=2792013 RepID=A0ABS6UJV1_9PSEU|nr:sugar ABC transporter permease [Pseudonocardia oceani]MBW0097971.1 sugar ABC transporter permease [Pseudonocardia oceani]MBW0110528.1 sugar ABC transporter permease [Pseudonocardia oceani]MBW0121579.1 sugar ABC transporter permease [Pseudonocardia oceani]MBW0132163.1 sugar ABC transporter permease [Pseudonocardia oceani]